MGPIYKPKGAAAEYGDYAVNIYTGCPHRCYYCFAPQVLHREREAFHSCVEPRKDIKMDESNAWGRIQEISVKVQVLQADEATIRGCMDALNGRYKSFLNMKYFRRYSWAKISTSLGKPEATARRWNDKALDRLGELLDDTPMVEELLGRASRARV